MNALIMVFGMLLVGTLAHALELPQSKGCSQPDVIRTAAQVDAARAELLRLQIGDGLQTDIPPAAQQAISSMKSALGNFVNEYMHCASEQADGKKVQSDISALVHTFRLPAGEYSNEQLPPDFGKYGFELWFEVRVTQDPKLVGIRADFSIECGGDTVLFVFAPDGDSWREVLRWQSKPYDTVAGGTMAFDYGISPQDEAHGWYVVVHNIDPWCSSTWSSIRYQVLRPTVDPLQPKVILSNSDFMWWGNEDYGKVVVGKNEFDLRFHSSSIDGGVHNRIFIRHYSVLGDTVRRTQPVAVSPRDFVDEWIVSPWEEASRWSKKSSLAHLQQAHKMMSPNQKAAHTLLEYDSIYRCSDGKRYQVGLGEMSGPKSDNGKPEYFFVEGEESFTMVGVSEAPDPKCGGPNLLEKMATK